MDTGTIYILPFSGTGVKTNIRFPMPVIFAPFFQKMEVQNMAKAKYTRQKNGYFQARVWDGTYQGTQKHYITIRSKKSSKDLEEKVTQYNNKIKDCKNCN